MEAEVRRHILSRKLKQAIGKENLGMIHRVGEELERHGIDINGLDRYDTHGATALMLASEHPKPAMLNALCELGADVNATDYMNNTALCYSTAKGNSECVIALCSKPGIDPNIIRIDPQYLGESPLMYACWKCTPEAVEALISCGADVNAAAQAGDRYTPLIYAIYNVHGIVASRRIVGILLDKRANIYTVGSDGDPVFEHPRWDEVRIADPDRPLNTARGYRERHWRPDAAARAAARAAAGARTARLLAARKRALSAGKTRRNAIQREANLMPPHGKNFVALQHKYSSHPAFRRESLTPTNLSLVDDLIGGRRQLRRDTKKRRNTRRR